ncbi:hypothetical protein O181_108028 [Austropuccinia psidii MF-1]|uniref:SCA7 domain-containing protein n=1 Tax=Austropuccinia psidii MF-1 TaxID=1389203 RepID=A0A9Q3JS17_9BASI|nr:hypothetical protein [Austropuccinia psidii MF-1]
MKLKDLKDSEENKKLNSINLTINSLKFNQIERWKNLKLLLKQHSQQSSSQSKQNLQLKSKNNPHPDNLVIPIWNQRMDTFFGAPEDQLRLIKCDQCGIFTRESNGKVDVTHRLNCEMLRKSGPIHGLGKKFGNFLNLENVSKKRASSEVSLDSTTLPIKKKKTTIIDHTIPESERSSIFPSMTKKQIKKALAAAERLEKEKERKEKKRLEEEARKAKKMIRAKGGPVNVNEQCGVLIPPNDIPCARSLTCKTHSMGAKRSVPGRNAPYDILLNEWQKKHNPNWGDRKVVTPRVGPGVKPGLSKKKKKELGNTTNHNINPSSSTQGVIDSSKKQSSGVKDKTTGNSNSNSKQTSSKTQTGGSNGVSSHSNKKKEGHGHHKTQRSTTEKISAANEAKLLGEIDEDFYLIIPPKPQPKPLRTETDQDGDTRMNEAEVVEEGLMKQVSNDGVLSPKKEVSKLVSETVVTTVEAGEEDEVDSPSDVELELVIKGLISSKSGQPLARQSMASAWLNPRWSKFGKLGIKENFREAFKTITT